MKQHFSIEVGINIFLHHKDKKIIWYFKINMGYFENYYLLTYLFKITITLGNWGKDEMNNFFT